MQVTAGPAGRIRQLSTVPIWVAPMAGGPSTPRLVNAAAQAGAFGFLAAGYQSATALAAEMDTVRAAATTAFGVNVFVPGSPAADPAAVRGYVEALATTAASVGAQAAEPSWDDDHWADKIALLLDRPPPLVSFTFGCPPPAVISGLQAQGALVGVTVTVRDEAVTAVHAGADCLIVQGHQAGAHRATFRNDEGKTDTDPAVVDLLADIAAVTGLPLIAAGGISDAGAVSAALEAGAVAVALGTAFLRCGESGAHPLHKAALADPRFTVTEVTRAFSGRPARALVNQFVRDHRGAPAAYPEINNATRPIRAAATAAADVEQMSLYAGVGFRIAADAPAAEIIAGLTAGAAGGATGAAGAARALLAAERDRTRTRITALERDFDGIVQSSASAATDDEHDPEGTTIAFERQHAAALLDQARGQLADIAAAFSRIAAGGYGSCAHCGQPIHAGRLEARPTALTCIGCAAAGQSRTSRAAGRPASGSGWPAVSRQARDRGPVSTGDAGSRKDSPDRFATGVEHGPAPVTGQCLDNVQAAAHLRGEVGRPEHRRPGA